MTDLNPVRFTNDHPRLTAALTFAASLALLAVVMLFAWNSFAVPVLELSKIQFKEALGLTLLVAVVGRLLIPTHPAAHRDRRAQP